MRRPPATREALRRSPLMKAGGTHPARVECVPLIATGAEPFVLFARRPAAEWASDARTSGIETLLLIWLAIDNDRRVVVREGTHTAIL